MYSIFFGLLIALNITIVILAQKDVINRKYSYTGLFLLSFLAFLIVFFNGFTFDQIGLNIPTNLEISTYLLITVICCIIIFLLNSYWFKYQRHASKSEISATRFFFYTLLSVTLQEFLFRSFIYYSLLQMNIFNFYTMTMMSFLLFGIAHLAFKGRIFKLGVFIMGIVWGVLYFYIPNLILISISHAIVGMFAYYQGLVDQNTFFMHDGKNTKTISR